MDPKPTTAEWQPISSATKTAKWVIVKMKDGTIHRAHWASDLSGEEQPAFQGWFIQWGRDMSQIAEPVQWMNERDYDKAFGGAAYGPK
jgi:hypothetical protein